MFKTLKKKVLGGDGDANGFKGRNAMGHGNAALMNFGSAEDTNGMGIKQGGAKGKNQRGLAQTEVKGTRKKAQGAALQEKPANMKVDGRATRRGAAQSANESHFLFKTVKKRKTIQMEDSIDLSTDSVPGEPARADQDGDAAEEACFDDIIRMELPKAPEKIKSFDIHKRVGSGNINELIARCIQFLKADSDYAANISRDCRARRFGDIDYEKEIKSVVAKTADVQVELDKWNGVHEEQKRKNFISIERLAELNVGGHSETAVAQQQQDMIEEFREKAACLNGLEERLKYFFENAKAKSEVLLKSIFSSVENKSVDAMFLLKAMSKLGR